VKVVEAVEVKKDLSKKSEKIIMKIYLKMRIFNLARKINLLILIVI
jgi:hypothetical protein